MKLLVHACCGPCSIMPTRLLREEGHEITLYYANSNIAPRAEYDKRLGELKRYASDQGFPVVEGDYDPASWERDVASIGEAIKDFSPALRGCADASGPKGALDGAGASPRGRDPQSVAELLDDDNRRKRCRACYRMRLQQAASFASSGGYDALSTTLAVSPYQFTDVIADELDRACAQAGIDAHFTDYRPYYDEATRISRELGMYRQNYCGCRFSIKEGEATRAFIKQQREARKAEKARQREEEQRLALKRKAEKQAYAEERARRRAILKGLRS